MKESTMKTPTTPQEYQSREGYSKVTVYLEPFVFVLDSILRRAAIAPPKTLAFADGVAFIHNATSSTSSTPQTRDTMSKYTSLSINLSKTATMTLKQYTHRQWRHMNQIKRPGNATVQSANEVCRNKRVHMDTGGFAYSPQSEPQQRPPRYFRYSLCEAQKARKTDYQWSTWSCSPQSTDYTSSSNEVYGPGYNSRRGNFRDYPTPTTASITKHAVPQKDPTPTSSLKVAPYSPTEYAVHTKLLVGFKDMKMATL